MSLLSLWNTDRTQIIAKRIDQLIAFDGEGRLLDGNSTCLEFRELLKAVTSEILGKWLDECLEVRFPDFGFVLQDVVNEIGRRLGFDMTYGYYRSHSNEGYDGLWKVPGGRALLVESKSSNAYSINLQRIADYRKQVAPIFNVRPEDITILIVVGAENTDDFEAQVRGSRYAWDIRLLGTKSLYKLLKLKEALEDPAVEKQIQGILFPQEFTRLDGIIDLIFATAEEAQENVAEESDAGNEAELIEAGDAPANFHSEILPQLEKHFGQSLVRQSRSLWSTLDDKILVSCRVSKYFDYGVADYWFGLKRPSRDSLGSHNNAYCAFGLGSPKKVVLIPMSFLNQYIDNFFNSPEKDGGIRHWHVRFVNTDEGVALLTDRDRNRLDVSHYLMKDNL